MISERFDTREFIEAVKQKDYNEILYLADREALEAWRRSHRCSGPGKEKMRAYASELKHFMLIMRSDVGFGAARWRLFQATREEVLGRESERIRRMIRKRPESEAA